MTGRRLRTLVLVCAAAGCGDGPRGADVFRQPHGKSIQQRQESTDVVARATRALHTGHDVRPLHVESVTRGTEGWLVRLLPPAEASTTGGGTVWVGVDGSSTVIKRY